MEASLLAARKPSVPFFFAARGSSRRCLVVAGGHGKNLETHPQGSNNGAQQEAVPIGTTPMARARGGLFAVAAAAVTSGAALTTLPSAASSSSTELYDYYFRAAAVLGDLDPATAKTVAGVAGPALSALGFLFILRIVMSWYPRLPVTRFPYVLAYAPTEPFLAVTRKVIPPLGGVDVTPVVWFGLVSFLSEILVGPQGLLVLLSQQQP